MKLAALATLLSLAAMPAQAARLCRDGKGLFTPCTPAEAARHRRAAKPIERGVPDDAPTGDAATADTTTGAAATGGAEAAPAPRARSTRPARRAMVARGRLCRDGKGLATPCPR